MKNVGIDIVDLNNITLNNNFIKRFLSNDEFNEYTKIIDDKIKKIKFVAKHWALKEAIYKALNHEHLVFNKINITKNEYNQPKVVIKDYNIKLSVSYSKTSVIAIAIVF